MFKKIRARLRQLEESKFEEVLFGGDLIEERGVGDVKIMANGREVQGKIKRWIPGLTSDVLGYDFVYRRLRDKGELYFGYGLGVEARVDVERGSDKEDGRERRGDMRVIDGYQIKGSLEKGTGIKKKLKEVMGLKRLDYNMIKAQMEDAFMERANEIGGRWQSSKLTGRVYGYAKKDGNGLMLYVQEGGKKPIQAIARRDLAFRSALREKEMEGEVEAEVRKMELADAAKRRLMRGMASASDYELLRKELGGEGDLFVDMDDEEKEDLRRRMDPEYAKRQKEMERQRELKDFFGSLGDAGSVNFDVSDLDTLSSEGGEVGGKKDETSGSSTDDFAMVDVAGYRELSRREFEKPKKVRRSRGGVSRAGGISPVGMGWGTKQRRLSGTVGQVGLDLSGQEVKGRGREGTLQNMIKDKLKVRRKGEGAGGERAKGVERVQRTKYRKGKNTIRLDIGGTNVEFVVNKETYANAKGFREILLDLMRNPSLVPSDVSPDQSRLVDDGKGNFYYIMSQEPFKAINWWDEENVRKLAIYDYAKKEYERGLERQKAEDERIEAEIAKKTKEMEEIIADRTREGKAEVKRKLDAEKRRREEYDRLSGLIKELRDEGYTIPHDDLPEYYTVGEDGEMVAYEPRMERDVKVLSDDKILSKLEDKLIEMKGRSLYSGLHSSEWGFNTVSNERPELSAEGELGVAKVYILHANALNLLDLNYVKEAFRYFLLPCDSRNGLYDDLTGSFVETDVETAMDKINPLVQGDERTVGELFSAYRMMANCNPLKETEAIWRNLLEIEVIGVCAKSGISREEIERMNKTDPNIFPTNGMNNNSFITIKLVIHEDFGDDFNNPALGTSGAFIDDLRLQQGTVKRKPALTLKQEYLGLQRVKDDKERAEAELERKASMRDERIKRRREIRQRATAKFKRSK